MGACIVALAVARAAEPASSPAPRVLLINSYSAATRWSVELTAGVREVIAVHFPRASLAVEYLVDASLAPDVVLARVAERLQQEHARERFAVTIAADDAAFEFALAKHDEILPGSPLVFCGVSDLPPDVLGPHRLLAGTIQVHDVSTLMATALKRQPATRALVVVHDLSPAGLAYREQVQSWTLDIQRRRPGLEVAFLGAAQYSTAELIEQIRVLPLDCLVLLTSWSQDRDGHAEQLDDVLARVARVSPVPVYGVSGAGGGFSTSEARLKEARQQGETAGTVAVKILQGVPPSEIPIRIVRSAPELEAASSIEGDGSASAFPLPLRSETVQVPLSRSLFLALCAVAAGLQTALVGMLFVVLQRRRRAQRDLERARRLTAQIIDSAELGVLEWDVVTGAMTFNSHYAERLGYLPEDIQPTRQQWQSMVHPDDLLRVLTAQQECLDDQRTSYSVRYRLLTHSGTHRWVLERGEATARLADGSPCQLLGVQTDGEPPPWPESTARR
jgi:sigma-B regulation protein RsbU (phosphoserine phosphatase)